MVHRSRHFTFILIMLLGAVCGCRESYMFGNQKFDNPRDALLAQSADAENILSAISPTAYPVGGTLEISLPTSERIRQTGIKVVGSPSAKLWSYMVTGTERTLDLQAEAVRRRKIFHSVIIEKQFEIGDPPDGDTDYVLWLTVPEPGTSAWYFRRRGTNERDLVPLDTGLSAGVPRMTAWLDYLERIARGATSSSQGGKSVSNGTNPTDRLQKLEHLHEQGVITDEEYRKARARALDEL